MKNYILLTILASLFSVSAFSQDMGERSTECPMMSESNSRHNPKEKLSEEVKRPVHLKGVRGTKI